MSASGIETQSTVSKSRRGGARPGAGRPKGGKNASTLELQALARECAPAALACLKMIAAKGKSEPARVAAAQAILDRAYGRPRQAVEHTGADGAAIEVKVTRVIVRSGAH